MYWTKSFIPTLKEAPQEAESASHKLLLRAGMARMLMAGVYSYLPLGLRVLNNIEGVIRQEMNACGANELLLPALQPKELWVESGRDKLMGEVMIRFVDRRGRHICLGPTHEEVVTDLARAHIASYRQLPLVLYQIQTKFRDEIRPRFGLVRACEFIMKDAYSFDRDQAGLEKNYQAMHRAYLNIFRRCGLKVYAIQADSGVMGGSLSHEFMVPAENGEDVVLACPACGQAQAFSEDNPAAGQCPGCSTGLVKTSTIEIGHIFQLGTKYSESLGAKFLDSDGKSKPVIMGCYGIGVSRLISAVIEQNHDDKGIIWPEELSPYKIAILPLDVNDTQVMQEAGSIYTGLSGAGIEPLFDDRDERPGVKFNDTDLTGIPLILIVGQKGLKDGKVELKARRTGRSIMLDKSSAIDSIKQILQEKN